MTLDELILHAGGGSPKAALDEELVARAAESMGVGMAELCDFFARRVGELFLEAKLSWNVADIAMNKLFAFGVTQHGAEMSRLVWDVYIAFDQAEYRRPECPSNFDRTALTRDLLKKALLNERQA